MKMMDSHLIGSNNIIEIRTKYVDFVIKAKKTRTDTTCHSKKDSSVIITGFGIEQINIPCQDIFERHVESHGYSTQAVSISPAFFEQTDYIVTVKSKNQESLEFISYGNTGEGNICNIIDDDHTLLTGVINFNNNVGYTDFSITANEQFVLSVRLEIYPSKISYKEDYQKMMADINNMVNDSILDFMRKAYQVFVPDHRINDVPAVFFTVLESVFGKYLQAINRIVYFPHHKLITSHEILPYHKVNRTDSKSEKWLKKHSELITKSGKAIYTEKILAAKKQVTYDTLENQLVKFMLFSTIKSIEDFTLRYKKSARNTNDEIVSKAKKMENQLRHILNTTFLKNVSNYISTNSMSLVFNMAPGYREMYKYFLVLRNGISVGGEVFKMSVKDTAQLYEYWCFIKLYAILREHYILKSPDIIKVDRNGVTVDLQKGQASRIKFVNEKTGESIILSYNPSETVTQTVNQKPDNVLELEKKGSSVTYKYVFDAKYRIESNPDNIYYPDNKPGPKVDDINTMHRYRDSIVYQNLSSKFTFAKTMFGAYILFPYDNEKEYREHHFYKSIGSVNIGGLPFLPSATSLVTDLLEELITDSSESAFERASLPIGIEEKLKTVEWNNRDVLIGLVTDDREKDIYINKKVFYTKRINRKNLPVRYIALYEKGKGIQFYGELIFCQTKKLSEIREIESDENDEKYYAFFVKKWLKLDSIIEKGGQGQSSLSYTNYFLLEHSNTYPELFIKSEEEYRFYSELKRRTNDATLKETDTISSFELNNIKVQFSDGEISVLNHNNFCERCSVEEFSKNPNRTFRRLYKYFIDER